MPMPGPMDDCGISAGDMLAAFILAIALGNSVLSCRINSPCVIEPNVSFRFLQTSTIELASALVPDAIILVVVQF